MNILPEHTVGLDISLVATGIADIYRCQHLGQIGILKMPLPEKTEAIRSLAMQICQAVPTIPSNRYGLAVIEYPNMNAAFGGQLERGWLWWETTAQLRLRGYLIAAPIQSQRSKFLTGKGNATKGAVVEQVARRWPSYQLHGDDNRADAIVYLKMGLARLGEDVGLPASHLQVLSQVNWPEGV